MERPPRFWLSQPLVGGVSTSLALVTLAASWAGGAASGAIEPEGVTRLVVALCSVIAIALAYRFPIYVRHNTKICVSSIPLYLIAVFLAPPLAAMAAGFGVAAGEMLARSRHANSIAVVATHTGRWMLVVLLGSRIVHAPLSTADVIPHVVLLAAGAAVMFLGDLLTVPLALAPLTAEPVPRIVLSCLRGGGWVEGAQYGVGMLGALLVEHQA